MPILEKNQVIPLEITALTHEGMGIGRYDGMVIFVGNTAPGDVIEAKIVKILKSHSFGRLEKLLTPATCREENQCPIYPQCGGCTLRHISYEEELKQKQDFISGNVSRIGKIDLDWEPIIGSEKQDRYRNKAQFPLQLVDGKPRIGFYAARSHRLIPLDDCLLQPEVYATIGAEICQFMEEFSILPYMEKTGKGLVRHLCIRSNKDEKEIMVTLVINGKKIPYAKELIQRLGKFPSVKTITLSHNTQKNNVIMGRDETILLGDGVITDMLCGVQLEISSHSFYQVNHDGAEALYGKALEYANPTETDVLLDLYCGIGSIGLSMAHRVDRLIGVEIVPYAVENAKNNAKRNEVSNAQFLCADAGKAAGTLAEEGLLPTIVVVDPPRRGMDQKTIDAIVAMNPKKVVYVSCNSATLARDAALLVAAGYKATKGCGVDLFPRTTHVESVLLLEKEA